MNIFPSKLLWPILGMIRIRLVFEMRKGIPSNELLVWVGDSALFVLVSICYALFIYFTFYTSVSFLDSH